MLIALILFVGGGLIGFYSHVLIAFGLSALVLLLSATVWVIRAEVSVVGVLVFFAHLTALQAGYLVGAYLRMRASPDKEK
ncbi:hypothetical protein [Methylobacterium flocculans]|uniref:hypothetical protein n=1 Tax=Methylobacterium flocculans TaxID=2984843 RepID=UPI0021F271AB|nr:hypothetical protein [Methylobacterium sp. FF17]